MSKKTMKRSLALGALMAFVITGSAMAADGSIVNGVIDTYSGTKIVANDSDASVEATGRSYGLAVTSGKHTLAAGDKLVIENYMSDTERNYGIAVKNNSTLDVNRAIEINVSGGTAEVRGIRNHISSYQDGGNLTFNDDVKITATKDGAGYIVGADTWGGITTFNGNADIHVTGKNVTDFTNAVQVGTNGTVKFLGDITTLTAINDRTGDDIYTAQAVALAKNGSVIYLNSKETNINAVSKYGSTGIGLGDDKTVTHNVYFNGEEGSVVNINVLVDNDGDGIGDFGSSNAIGVMANLNVSKTVNEFNINVKGSGSTSGANGTAGLYARDWHIMNIDAKKLNISIIAGTEKVEDAKERSDSYGIYAYEKGTVDINSNIVDIKVTDTIGKAYSFYAKDTASISVAADKANIKGVMYVGDGAILDISSINDLVLKGLKAGDESAAIQVDGGTLKVNTAGTLAIDGAEVGNTYKVVSGVADKSALWSDDNLAYDRTAMFATTALDADSALYTVSYKEIENLTEEEQQEAQNQYVAATGGEELAVPQLVGSAAGQGSTMEETAPGAKTLLSEVASNPDMPKETKAAVINSAAQLAEAGGNAGTAVSVASNVSNVTTGRMSFGAGVAKGGKGVGLFEENSGAAVWAQYMHGKDDATDMPMDGGATSYESEYDGIVLGVDFKKVGKFQSGIAFNYGEGDSTGFTSAAKTQSDYDFWGIGYYGNIRNDDTNFIFDVNYAKSDSDVTQNNVGATDDIEASPETTTWSAGVKVEKLYQNESVQIVPYTGLRYMSIDTDEYTSKLGGETLFNYAPERQDIWLLPLGVTIKQEVVNDNGWVVTPKVDLSYIWAFGDTDSNMSVSIPGIAASNDTLGFTVMDDGSFLGLVGVEAKLDDWTFGVSYSYQKGDYAESKKWFVDAKYSF